MDLHDGVHVPLSRRAFGGGNGARSAALAREVQPIHQVRLGRVVLLTEVVPPEDVAVPVQLLLTPGRQVLAGTVPVRDARERVQALERTAAARPEVLRLQPVDVGHARRRLLGVRPVHHAVVLAQAQTPRHTHVLHPVVVPAHEAVHHVRQHHWQVEHPRVRVRPAAHDVERVQHRQDHVQPLRHVPVPLERPRPPRQREQHAEHDRDPHQASHVVRVEAHRLRLRVDVRAVRLQLRHRELERRLRVAGQDVLELRPPREPHREERRPHVRHHHHPGDPPHPAVDPVVRLLPPVHVDRVAPALRQPVARRVHHREEQPVHRADRHPPAHPRQHVVHLHAHRALLQLHLVVAQSVPPPVPVEALTRPVVRGEPVHSPQRRRHQEEHPEHNLVAGPPAPLGSRLRHRLGHCARSFFVCCFVACLCRVAMKYRYCSFYNRWSCPCRVPGQHHCL
eukprot:Rhum_TRINITY_DN14535_c0_g1::Rhum_TRINITY_DN14535_c0_g1_i1::g.98275::m.98275